MQSHPLHHAVDHERDAREVARVLEKPDKQEEHQDLRGKHDDVPDTRDDALDDEVLEHPRGKEHRGLRLHQPRQALDRGDKRLSPGEERLEDAEHHGGENDQPRNRMRQHAVDALAP